MIKVENLTKVYNTKDNTPVLALDNINLILPEKGMVFICGPSGSGKSTLLNILAGFDDISDGEIIIDGNNLKDLSEESHDSYRSSLVGFVFQDYHLINNLTVKENIEIPLIVNENNSLEQISKYLDKVGLSDLGDRYPSELSGGQKQRVAIARCLVKNPKYILADEPTGNLDYDTSIQILELFKELSKDRLILLISHNRRDAYSYADRIIEIDNGKIVKDVQKDPNISLIDNEFIYLSEGQTLTEEELELINNKMKSGSYTLVQRNNKFKITNVEYEDNNIELRSINNISLSKIKNLSKPFTKNNILSLIAHSLSIFLLLTALLILQMLFNFDSSKVEISNINQDMSFVLYKNSPYSHMLSPILDTDIEEIYQKGYTGNIYKLYSYNMPTDEDGPVSIRRDLMTNKHVNYDIAITPMILAGKGVLECDLDYLTNIYGVDGELDLLAGSLEDSGKCEVIITDYFADCIKYYRGISFSDIVNIDYIDWEQSRYRVKAIINTNYTTRYEELFKKYENIIQIKDTKRKNKLLNELKNTEMFINFYNELNTYLSIGYFVDGDFFNRLKTDTSISCNCRSINPEFFMNDQLLYTSDIYSYSYHTATSLKPGEVLIGTTAYQQIFNENYLDATFPKEFTFCESYLVNESDDYDYKQDLKIVGILESGLSVIFLSNEDYYNLYDLSVFNYGLYFDNNDSIKSIYNQDKDIDYFTNDDIFNAIKEVNNIVLVFSDIFGLITIFIYLIIAILLLNFVYKNIKHKMKEIGILRSLGVRIKEILIIVLFQVLFVFAIAFGLSVLTICILDDFVNQLLVKGLMDYANLTLQLDITLIRVNVMTIIINGGIILSLIMLSSLLYVWLLRKIKPINIIKKEE